uniref:FHA domain-containing protein n=1 Tax=Panagrellus redivivus TaxID=6233 RepID=A0A7E4W0H5_PANRE
MRTFLSAVDEPLNANRLRLVDRKLGSECESKSFLSNGGPSSSSGIGSGTALVTTGKKKSFGSSAHVPGVNGLLHSPVAIGHAFGFGFGPGRPGQFIEATTSAIIAPKPTKPSALNGHANGHSNGVTSNGILMTDLPSRSHIRQSNSTQPPMMSDPTSNGFEADIEAMTKQHRHVSTEDEGRASSCSDRAADNEVSETLKSSENGNGYHNQYTHDRTVLVPTKWQVLYFVAHAKALRIKKTGCELQVTDTANFPLFDVFQKSHCFRATWILEAYGRNVLVISDASKSFTTRKNETPSFTVTNSENENMGHFVMGDPFIIQNGEKAVVARYTSFESSEPRLRNWQCILEGTGQEIAMLEHRKPQVYIIKFSGQLGFALKLMVLAAAVQIAATTNAQSKACCTIL